MVSTGIRTPIGIKVTGDDLTQIEAIAREIEGVVTDIPGTRSAFADRVLGGKYLEITPNRLELARRNIDMGAFQGVIQTALGGMTLPSLLQRRAEAGTTSSETSVILFWMWGGPSQLETWDMKPDAPSEYRGPLHPISTNVPASSSAATARRLSRP